MVSSCFGAGVVLVVALARFVCIRSDGDHGLEASPGSAIETDVQTTATRTLRPLGSDLLRPLGSDLMVDKNGTIWREQQPIGLWGVNGGEPADTAKLR